MNAVTCQASGVRASTDRRRPGPARPPPDPRRPRPHRPPARPPRARPPRARPGPARSGYRSCGSQTAAAISAGQRPQAQGEPDRRGRRPPPGRPAPRSARPRWPRPTATAGTGRSAGRPAPGWRRLTRLGSSTFISAMALPGDHRAGKQQGADGAAPRTSSPAASRTRAAPEHALLAEAPGSAGRRSRRTRRSTAPGWRPARPGWPRTGAARRAARGRSAAGW